jgi:8-oxo-dGTP diphosphatase
VLLVRHASAGDPDQWTGDDRLRPLDAKGRRQTEALRRILPVFGPSRLLSVHNVRCVDTVTALAADLGLDGEPAHALSEQEYAAHPGRGRDLIR